MKPTFVTTSIAYANAEPHIGFLFELVAADIIARSAKLQGQEAFLLSGTDEHGIKVAQAAQAANARPQEFVDQIAGKFEALSQQFNVETDYFIRTTNPEHIKFVQAQWARLSETGALKKKTYSGLYCNGCEAFKTASEIKDNHCLIHETELEKIEEENWFLIIDQATKDKIKAWVDEAVFPVTRRQEVVNILKSGAYDEVSVSRPRSKNSWGVPVPGDDDQIMYVWVDALFNYLSALEIVGQPKLWPADVQVIGKDILKFHAIIWPALLLATGYALPTKLLVHGFINVDGKKMSKSLGNVVTPQQLLDRYGAEATRYLLFRQLNFEDDSNFVWEEFDAIYNGELANGLGNLLARLIGISKKIEPILVKDLPVEPNGELIDYRTVLDQANGLINQADQIITKEQLWQQPESKREQLTPAWQCLHQATGLLRAFMPKTALEIDRQRTELESTALFPRLEK